MDPQTVSAPTIDHPADAPLTADHRRQLALAAGRAKKIRTAAALAGFNGWAIGIVAALSLPFALFSLVGFLIALGLAVVAYNEFRGRRRLLAFDPSAATWLGWNQLGLLAMITVYCGWMIFTGLASPNPLAAEIAAHPEYEGVLGSLDGFDALYKQVVVLIYGAVIVVSAFFQGANAWYNFTRRRQIEAFLRETPAWVLDVQRSL